MKRTEPLSMPVSADLRNTRTLGDADAIAAHIDYTRPAWPLSPGPYNVAPYITPQERRGRVRAAKSCGGMPC